MFSVDLCQKKFSHPWFKGLRSKNGQWRNDVECNELFTTVCFGNMQCILLKMKNLCHTVIATKYIIIRVQHVPSPSVYSLQNCWKIGILYQGHINFISVSVLQIFHFQLWVFDKQSSTLYTCAAIKVWLFVYERLRVFNKYCWVLF